MCIGGLFGSSKPSTPAPPPLPPPLPPITEPSDEDVVGTRQRARRRAATAGGRESTILTGPKGLGPVASTTQNTILGTA